MSSFVSLSANDNCQRYFPSRFFNVLISYSYFWNSFFPSILAFHFGGEHWTLNIEHWTLNMANVSPTLCPISYRRRPFQIRDCFLEEIVLIWIYFLIIFQIHILFNKIWTIEPPCSLFNESLRLSFFIHAYCGTLPKKQNTLKLRIWKTPSTLIFCGKFL